MKIYSSLGPFKEELFKGRIRSFTHIIDKLKKAGFDGIEINSIVFEIYNQRILPLNLSFKGIDYSMVSLHSNYLDFNLGSIDSYTRHACIEQAVNEYGFALKNGIRTVTIHPGRVKGIQRETAMKLLWDSLSQIFTKIQKSGTKLCLENMDNKKEKLCNNPSEIEETLSKFPELGLTVDLAHLGLNNEDIGMFLDKFESRIYHIHISGVREGFPHSEVSLAKSEIDFAPFLIRYSGKDIAVVIENHLWEDVVESKEILERIV